MLHEPDALVVDLLLLLAVIAFGPFVAERLRLPGIIGLLLGGFVIGPTGLGLLRSEAEVNALGEVGLLYLMFLAGLELDLNVFARVRAAAVQFGLLTFALPLLAGTVTGQWLGFDLPASILIGSLWASHTLVMYPIVQRYGITADPAVATTVGATVITDTLALLVLAIIASGAGGEGGIGSNIALVVGLGLLVVFCFVVLVRVTGWFFSSLGQDRGIRFIFVFGAFLSAALVAEVAGIEGIVGAFFAGLALNRLVPNGGPLMDRIEFFGASLFIPSFLVSVGLLIDPAVLVDPRTWQLAAVFTFALVVGKGLAAIVIGKLRGFSLPQMQVVFSLSLSQAAATLAATTVGAEVGLFGQDVVNAVVVVIVISLFASSLLATRAGSRVAPPTREGRPLGASIVAALEDAAAAARVAPVLARIAARDGGVVVPTHIVADGEGVSVEDSRAAATAIDEAIRKVGIEAEHSLRVAQSVRQGVRNEIATRDASLLVLLRHGAIRAQDYLFGGLSEEIVAASPVPVMVAEMDEEPVRRVVVPIRPHDLSHGGIADTRLALQVADRLERSGLDLVVAVPDPGGADEAGIPADATVVRLDGGRTRWIKANAQPGDLVVLPGGGQQLVFGQDAARVSTIPGVSCAVIVGAFSKAGFPSGAPVGTIVVGHTGPA